MAEILMQKLPDIFSVYFRREGNANFWLDSGVWYPTYSFDYIYNQVVKHSVFVELWKLNLMLCDS